MVDDGRQPTRTLSVIDEALDSVIHTRAAVVKAIRKTKKTTTTTWETTVSHLL